MAISNPLDILLAHNHWATRNVLDACSRLSREQFHARFDLGPGSLHDTLTHTLSAMRIWTDVLYQRPVAPVPEGAQYTQTQLLEWLDVLGADLENIAHSRPLDEIVVRERSGKVWKHTRGGVITHVTTHGMHHRAQCLNMLKHLGVSPMPESSVAEWMRAVDPIG